jgi:hypothetical protein
MEFLGEAENRITKNSVTCIGMVTEEQMGKECSTNGEKRKTDMLLVGKREEKPQLGRPRRRWADSRRDLREIG